MGSSRFVSPMTSDVQSAVSLLALPRDVLLRVIGHLILKEKCYLQAVCRVLSDLLNDTEEALWGSTALERDFL